MAGQWEIAWRRGDSSVASLLQNDSQRTCHFEPFASLEGKLREESRYSANLPDWSGVVIDVWRGYEEICLGEQLALFERLLEPKEGVGRRGNRMQLPILCPKHASEMELLFMGEN